VRAARGGGGGPSDHQGSPEVERHAHRVRGSRLRTDDEIAESESTERETRSRRVSALLRVNHGHHTLPPVSMSVIPRQPSSSFVFALSVLSHFIFASAPRAIE